MKSLVIILFLALFLPFRPQCQNDSSGIYLTGHDYKAGKLSYVLDCHSAKDKIKLHDFFGKRYIDVIIGGYRKRLYKDSIYGYSDCHHNVYRFYHNSEREYHIEEDKGIVIYSSCLPVPPGDVKHFQFRKTYFFSVSDSSPVHPLTILNLKRAFLHNIKFHDLLDITFADGTPVYSYDTKHNTYIINYLLAQSLNQH